MVPIRCVSTGPKHSLRRFLVPTNFTQQPAIFQGPLGLTSAEYSACVLHRFETMMHRAGWVARRSGLRDRVPAAGPSPHLERYAGAMRLPMDLKGSPFSGKGYQYLFGTCLRPMLSQSLRRSVLFLPSRRCGEFIVPHVAEVVRCTS